MTSCLLSHMETTAVAVAAVVAAAATAGVAVMTEVTVVTRNLVRSLKRK